MLLCSEIYIDIFNKDMVLNEKSEMNMKQHKYSTHV